MNAADERNVTVTLLSPLVTKSDLEEYFSDPANGGGPVLRVVYPIADAGLDEAVIAFENVETAIRVCCTEHSLMGRPVAVRGPNPLVFSAVEATLGSWLPDCQRAALLPRLTEVEESVGLAVHWRRGRFVLCGTLAQVNTAHAMLQPLLDGDSSRPGGTAPKEAVGNGTPVARGDGSKESTEKEDDDDDDDDDNDDDNDDDKRQEEYRRDKAEPEKEIYHSEKQREVTLSEFADHQDPNNPFAAIPGKLLSQTVGKEKTQIATGLAPERNADRAFGESLQAMKVGRSEKLELPRARDATATERDGRHEMLVDTHIWRLLNHTKGEEVTLIMEQFLVSISTENQGDFTAVYIFRSDVAAGDSTLLELAEEAISNLYMSIYTDCATETCDVAVGRLDDTLPNNMLAAIQQSYPNLLCITADDVANRYLFIGNAADAKAARALFVKRLRRLNIGTVPRPSQGEPLNQQPESLPAYGAVGFTDPGVAGGMSGVQSMNVENTKRSGWQSLGADFMGGETRRERRGAARGLGGVDGPRPGSRLASWPIKRDDRGLDLEEGARQEDLEAAQSVSCRPKLLPQRRGLDAKDARPRQRQGDTLFGGISPLVAQSAATKGGGRSGQPVTGYRDSNAEEYRRNDDLGGGTEKAPTESVHANIVQEASADEVVPEMSRAGYAGFGVEDDNETDGRHEVAGGGQHLRNNIPRGEDFYAVSKPVITVEDDSSSDEDTGQSEADDEETKKGSNWKSAHTTPSNDARDRNLVPEVPTGRQPAHSGDRASENIQDGPLDAKELLRCERLPRDLEAERTVDSSFTESVPLGQSVRMGDDGIASVRRTSGDRDWRTTNGQGPAHSDRLGSDTNMVGRVAKAPTTNIRSGPSYSRRTDDKPTPKLCTICVQKIGVPSTLGCGHTFCQACIQADFESNGMFCPECGLEEEDRTDKNQWGVEEEVEKEVKEVKNGVEGEKGVKEGDEAGEEAHATNCLQPKDGTFTFIIDQKVRLEGAKKQGVAMLKFSFPAGTQESCHPDPGRGYTAADFQCYLAAGREGTKAVAALKKAFHQGRLFKVVRGARAGDPGRLVPHSITLKTCTTGPHGYPDSTYYSQLCTELQAKGIQME